MKLPVSLIGAALLAFAASAPLYAQAPNAEQGKPAAGKPAPRRFDCSKAQDPKGCEERLAKMREARDKARKACEGKSGNERRDCMEKAFCAEAQDSAKCEANLKERAARRNEVRAACKDKKGDELKACVKEHRAAGKKS